MTNRAGTSPTSTPSRSGQAPVPAAVLLLLRHGQSADNDDNHFGGWLDSALTARGEAEATRAGELIATAGLAPTVVHTSLLSRSTRTAELVLDRVGPPRPPVHRTWRLNERHYGAWQGRSRPDVRSEVGAATFRRVRRSYDGVPPPLDPAAAEALRRDSRYAGLLPGDLPVGESLAQVRDRVVVYWDEVLAPELRQGALPLVVGHGNSLRALCMHLDRLTPDEVLSLNIPTGVPLRYDLDASGVPLARGGTYLDAAAAAAGVAEVVAQGEARSAGRREPGVSG